MSQTSTADTTTTRHQILGANRTLMKYSIVLYRNRPISQAAGRSRSEWIELHLEDLFFAERKQKTSFFTRDYLNPFPLFQSWLLKIIF
jgi:hypothetical protein